MPASQIPNTVFGLMALIIVTLAGVIIFLFQAYRGVIKDKDAIQEARLVDARDTRDKLVEPIEKLARQQEITNELIRNPRSS